MSNDKNDTWRGLILWEMKLRKETFKDVEYCTLKETELDEPFDAGYGSAEGKPFLLWTHKRVYFPCVYDGLEWVDSVPRNPINEDFQHVGC